MTNTDGLGTALHPLVLVKLLKLEFYVLYGARTSQRKIRRNAFY